MPASGRLPRAAASIEPVRECAPRIRQRRGAETGHGHKVGELMAVLDDLLEGPEAKAVVFSQWLGTHELIRRA